jgi:gliding motility-associated lipoprotein GldB
MRTVKAILLSAILLLFSCKEEAGVNEEIEAINITLKVHRFDEDFARTTIETLPKTKSEYPYLFPSHFPDSVWVNKLRDTLQLQLNKEVMTAFKDFSSVKAELEKLFKYVTYYTPEIAIPEVITVTSYVDYNRKVIYADSLLLISLDTYLGENHTFYEGIQQYIRKNLKRDQILPDVVVALSKSLLPAPANRSFISQMIYEGKQLYYMDKVAPWLADYRKIGYTENELRWALANEAEVWRYFIDRKLLFSTDQKLRARFINPAPFSKFYLELDTESPGRIGTYIGWQIVRAYMENNDVSLQQMFLEPEASLFAKSGFKPRKNG